MQVDFSTPVLAKDIVPPVVTALIAVAGWFTLHFLSKRKDVSNKKKEIRLRFLVDAYRLLNRLVTEGINSERDIHDLRTVVADIHLFGTRNAVDVMTKCLDDFRNGHTATVGPWFGALKQELRAELGLEENSEYFGYSIGWGVESAVKDSRFSSNQYRVQQLIEAFKLLRAAAISTQAIDMKSEVWQSATAIVWLFGSPRQVELVNALEQQSHLDGSLVLEELIIQIWQDVRNEVGVSSFRLAPRPVSSTRQQQDESAGEA